jgi:hypothetical protein
MPFTLLIIWPDLIEEGEEEVTTISATGRDDSRIVRDHPLTRKSIDNGCGGQAIIFYLSHMDLWSKGNGTS